MELNDRLNDWRFIEALRFTVPKDAHHLFCALVSSFSFNLIASRQ